MMKVVGLIFLSGFLLFIACAKFNSYDMSAQESKQTLVNGTSRLDESMLSPFGIQETRLVGRTNPRVIYFCDAMHGWIGSGDKLYKTDDGAKTWNEVGFPAADQTEIRKILFLKPSLGWIVLRKKTAPYVSDNQEYESWLLHTNDEGKSWSVQYHSDFVVVTQVAFSDEQNGWLAGIRYIGSKGVTYTHLLLRTADQGGHWSDVSEGIIRITSDKKDVSGEPVNDGLVGVAPQDSMTADVITGRMRIIKTTDGGKNWHQIADLRREPVQAGIKRFGRTENHLWIASSMDAEEGIAGDLTVEEGNNAWVGYELGGVFFADAVRLSKREFLACGYIKSMKKNSAQHSAVFYSADGGTNWSIVYRNAKVKEINALAIVDSNHVCAVGEGGLILRIERSSGKASVPLSK